MVWMSGKSELKKGFMGKPSFFIQAAVLNEYDENARLENQGNLL
jgi:hypothetical protein